MKTFYRLLSVVALLSAAAGCHHDSATDPVRWQGQPTYQSLGAVRQLAFATPSAGWVVGGYAVPVTASPWTNMLLHTTNGGNTWAGIDLTPVNTAAGFRSFAAVNDQLLYGVADDLPLSLVRGAQSRFVYRSENGGQTWQRLPSTGFFDGSLAFASPSVGVSPSSFQLVRTTDSGQSWQVAWTDPQQRHSVSQAQFVTPTVGYATGNCVLKTTDQGQTWQVLPWTHGLITQATFLSAELGFLVTSSGIICDPGPCPDMGPTSALYRTQDGGQTWQQLLAPATGRFAFVSAHEFYRASSTIEHTSDEGQTWQTEYTLPSASSGSPDSFVSICFPAPEAGYAVTNNGLVVKRLTP